MSRSDNSIAAALDASFEYSTRPGLYVLSPEPYAIQSCPETKDVGISCTSTFGAGLNVDVDTELSGRLNTMPRGLYDAPPLPYSAASVLSASAPQALPETLYKFRGSLRGLDEGPSLPRIGRQWTFDIDSQDVAKIMPEASGMPRAGIDARLKAKDSA